MQKRRKSSINPFTIFLLFCMLLIVGPQIFLKESKPERKKPELPPFDKVERINIPIDETRAGEEALMTRNFYFIFDGSGSMDDPADGGCRGEKRFSKKIEGARWAIKEFMKYVPDDINIGLFVFDWHGRGEVVRLGKGNRDAFLNAIQKVKAAGGTPLAGAIRYGTDQLIKQYQKQLGYGEFRLVVITDGIAEGIPDAAIYAARYGIPIYAIGLCIGEKHPLREYAVSYRAADSFVDLAKGLEETLAESPVFDLTEFH